LFDDKAHTSPKGVKEDKNDAAASRLPEDRVMEEGDPTISIQNLQPNIPKDYELFLNLVEFCKMVLLLEPMQRPGRNNPIIKKEPGHQPSAAEEKVEGTNQTQFCMLSFKKFVQMSVQQNHSSHDGSTCSEGKSFLDVTSIHLSLVCS